MSVFTRLLTWLGVANRSPADPGDDGLLQSRISDSTSEPSVSISSSVADAVPLPLAIENPAVTPQALVDRKSLDTPVSPHRAIARTKKANRTDSSRIRVYVGFDFGTHSTKVVYRKHGDRRSHILSFDKRHSNGEYSQLVSPSLVCVDKGRLWFGTEAAERQSGTRYPNLKVELADPEKWECGHPVFPGGPTPQVLVAAYWAWAFQQILEGIHSKLGAEKPKLIWNLAAPMKSVTTAAVNDMYLHMAQAAWRATFGHEDEGLLDVSQGCRLDEVQSHLASSLHDVLLPEGERQFAVRAETIAPAASMMRNPKLKEGIYLLVDMGGGSTEISVNRLRRLDGNSHVHCYAEDLVFIGGHKFAELQACRDEEGMEKRQSLLDELTKRIKSVWIGGFEKNMHGPERADWKSLTIQMSGGGTLIPEVSSLLQSIVPQKQRFTPDDAQRPCVDRFRHVDFETEQCDQSLFACSHGLSIPEWPEWLRPDDVYVHSKEPSPYRPDPYWYVGGK